MKRTTSKEIALCGVLAALALTVMILGGMFPAASYCCPVLACTAESDQGWAVQYTFLDPEGDGSVLTFQLRLDDLLQLSVTPNEFFLSSA